MVAIATTFVRSTGGDPPTPRPVARWQLLAAVFVGGALGTLLRAGLAEWFPHGAGEWPVGTLAANLVAALGIGVVVGWVAAAPPGLDPRWRPLLATGVCGGLSTFATLQVELVRLLDDGAWGVAAAYVVVSVVAGVTLVVAGRAIGAALAPRDGATA